MAAAAGIISHSEQQVLPPGRIHGLHSKVKLIGKEL